MALAEILSALGPALQEEAEKVVAPLRDDVEALRQELAGERKAREELQAQLERLLAGSRRVAQGREQAQAAPTTAAPPPLEDDLLPALPELGEGVYVGRVKSFDQTSGFGFIE